MKLKKLLPIGSVVTVKDTEKKMMITGILQKSETQVYDYRAVLYPEGYMDAQHVYLFQHEDITEVSFLGYIDTEYQVFRNTLAAILKEKQEQEP